MSYDRAGQQPQAAASPYLYTPPSAVSTISGSQRADLLPAAASAGVIPLMDQPYSTAYDRHQYHHHHHHHPVGSWWHSARPVGHHDHSAATTNSAGSSHDEWAAYAASGSFAGVHHGVSPSGTSYTGHVPSGMLGSSAQAYNQVYHSSLRQQGLPLAPDASSGPHELSSGVEGKSSKHAYEWMGGPTSTASVTSNANGKTRTKEKYRVVYSDHQRLELEKEFHYSRYITIRRKTELSKSLSLSERQVKIWFQNRRAKDRKLNRKKDSLGADGETPKSAQAIVSLPHEGLSDTNSSGYPSPSQKLK